MTWIGLNGTWRVTVVRKDSDWPQRVVFDGARCGVLPGVVGASATVGGDAWRLTVEHDPGCGWRPSSHVAAGPVGERDGRAARTVVSKDHYWRGDSHPDDLVLRLEHVGAAFEVVGVAVESGDPYLAVTVRNSGHEAFDYDTALDVTNAGRTALAALGMVVDETWEPESLRATGQEAYGRAAGVPPLGVGERCVVRFPVRLAAAGDAPMEVEVEFVLFGAGGERNAHRGRLHVRAGDLLRDATPPRPPRPARTGAGEVIVAGHPVGVHARTPPPACPPAPAPGTSAPAPGASTPTRR